MRRAHVNEGRIRKEGRIVERRGDARHIALMYAHIFAENGLTVESRGK